MLRRSSARSLDAAVRDLKSDRHKIREAAAGDITRYAEDHRERVIEALTASLSDDHADVRAAALTALADVEAHEAVGANHRSDRGCA